MVGCYDNGYVIFLEFYCNNFKICFFEIILVVVDFWNCYFDCFFILIVFCFEVVFSKFGLFRFVINKLVIVII